MFEKVKRVIILTRKLTKRKLVIGLITLFFSALTIFIICFFINNAKEDKTLEELNQQIQINVETLPDEGREHTEEPVSYQSFPPTSGNHHPKPAEYGFYVKEVKFEHLVHSLEHGDIVLYYQNSLSDEELAQLRELSQFTYKGSGVIVLPNKDIKAPIVLTAWTKKANLDSFDIKQIKQFIYDHINKGPEKLIRM